MQILINDYSGHPFPFELSQLLSKKHKVMHAYARYFETPKANFKSKKKNSNLKIIGGLMEEEPLSIEEVEKIATLPTLSEARANIVGILRSPAQKIMCILLAPGSKIAILAHAKSKKT